MAVFRSGNNFSLPFSEYKSLAAKGIVELGINDEVSQQLTSIKLNRSNVSGANAANFLWNSVGWVLLSCSIYLSATWAWWAFIPGILFAGGLWNVTKQANSVNFLNDADRDFKFYDHVRDLGGWLYKVEDGSVGDFMIKTLQAKQLACEIIVGEDNIDTYEKAKLLLVYCGIQLSSKINSSANMDDENEFHYIEYDDPSEDGAWFMDDLSTKRMFLQVVRSKIAEHVVDGKLSSRNEVDDWSVLGV